MSLVDYASSSEDDAEVGEEEGEEVKQFEDKKEDPPPSAVNYYNQRSISSTDQQPDGVSHSSAPSIEKLPDASLLLISAGFSSHLMNGSDHYSRVAAAMAESEARKRESNGSASSYIRSKCPRGNLPHSRNMTDTVGGLLVPPQLSGRSNVVTEDISKLFVKRPAEAPSH